MDKTIVCIASTGERHAVRFLLYVRCGKRLELALEYRQRKTHTHDDTRRIDNTAATDID